MSAGVAKFYKEVVNAVLTIEDKLNLLAPARGERFRMDGQVVKPGRTITVADGRAYAIDAGGNKLIATMSCTLMAVVGRDGLVHYAVKYAGDYWFACDPRRACNDWIDIDKPITCLWCCARNVQG